MFINGRFYSQNVTGVQRFSREIVQASVANGLMNQSEILLPSKPASTGIPEGISVRTVGTHGGHLWEQTELVRAAEDKLLVSLCGTAPIWREQQLVVLHDAAVAANPKNFKFSFWAWYQFMIRSYGFRAKKIGTVSHFSADEIAKHFGISPKKIEVIPESGEHILRTPADYSLHEKLGLEQDGYFLAVSSLAPNKNFMKVLQAVALLPKMPFKFVVVGARNSKIFHSGSVDVTGAVETGYVSDAQLRGLYERAACFVYPSLYEGFGLPPLEAMSCGCPVLSSNTSSLPEVCGDAAIYCDPYSVEDIAKQLSKILQSTNLRHELRAKGLAHAQKWTWANAAKRLNEIATSI